MIAAVAMLLGEPGNVPFGGMKCREFSVAALSSELEEKDTSTPGVPTARTVQHDHG